MWTFIIIILAIILIKFFYDTANQSSKIREQGGMSKKYSILISDLLKSHDGCRIIQEDNAFIALGVTGSAGSQVFYIYPSYGKVSIRMEIKNNPIIGNKRIEWSFPENMSQEDMLKNIDQGIKEKYISWGLF